MLVPFSTHVRDVNGRPHALAGRPKFEYAKS